MEQRRDAAVLLPRWEQLPDIGLYMDQVVTLVDRVFVPRLPKGETTRSMVNNYVKSGLVPRPVGKKYDREHIARLLMVLVLKQALSMEGIAKLLEDLTAGGAEAGYARFSALLARIEEAVQRGRIDLDGEMRDPRDRALECGIMAALCTIRTYRLLEERQKEDAP